MKKIFTLLAFLLPFAINAQLHVNFSIDGNYWEHTDLYGLQGGIGLEYRKDKLAFRAAFNFGYGEYNRLKEEAFRFKKADMTTLYVDYGSLERINYNSRAFNGSPRNTKTDYARQHQLDLMTGYKVLDKGGKGSLWLYGGVFASAIDHFYLIDVLEAVLSSGERLNAFIYSDQRFYTVGGQLEIAGEWQHKNTLFVPYIRGGFGPNYTSFASLGFRITGLIRRK